MSNLFDIKDLNFVIAGGLGQVGLKLSEHLEKNGSKMVILDLFDKKKLVSLKKKNLFLSSKKIKILSVDISKKSKIEKSLNKITNFLKRINVLVNLAAVDTNNKGKFDKKINFHNFPDKSLRKSIDVNLIGSLNLSQIFCKYFVKNNIAGNIINVASIYSIVGPNLALYNKKISKNFNTNKPIDYVMSKSSIPNLTKYIAINYGRKNIRSNCVVPHGIKNLHKKDFVQKFSNLSPIGRMSDVKEVIGPIIFLSSNASSYMTGSTLIVDGGWTAW